MNIDTKHDDLENVSPFKYGVILGIYGTFPGGMIFVGGQELRAQFFSMAIPSVWLPPHIEASYELHTVFSRTGDQWGGYPDSNEAHLDDHSLLNFWCRNSKILWIWLVSYDSWIHIFREFLVALIGATKLNKIIRQSFERNAVCSIFLMFHYLKRMWRNLHVQTLYLPWTKPLLRVFWMPQW